MQRVMHRLVDAKKKLNLLFCNFEVQKRPWNDSCETRALDTLFGKPDHSDMVQDLTNEFPGHESPVQS